MHQLHVHKYKEKPALLTEIKKESDEKNISHKFTPIFKELASSFFDLDNKIQTNCSADEGKKRAYVMDKYLFLLSVFCSSLENVQIGCLLLLQQCKML